MASPTKAELQARLAKLERALAREKQRKGDPEALARARDARAATAEILRVIRKSPSDVQPVFEAIADATMRLLKAFSVLVVRYDGSQMQLAAARGARPGSVARVRALYPRSPGNASIAGRCILARKVVNHADAWRDRNAEVRKIARTRGYRSALAVPLLDGREPIGAISVSRTEVGAFARVDVDLLQTFADQAVIAIENARAFHEVREALAEQKASGEVLTAIAGSMSDATPVFDRILEACERLFAGYFAGINVIGDDGLVHLGGYRGPRPKAYARLFPMKSPDSATGIAMATRKIVHYPDLEAPGVPRGPRESGRATGVRSAIMAPLLAEEGGIGSIYVTRKFAGAFSEREIARLEGFAKQATIAIKNARQFRETQEALERQTATADILKVISGSPSDVQPVFDAVAESLMRLLGGLSAGVTLRDGDTLNLVAFTSTNPSGDDALKKMFPINLREERSGPSAQVALSGEPIRVSDSEDPGVPARMRETARRRGFRSFIVVPMLNQGAVIGTLSVTRRKPGAFDDHDVDLLTTFADQAVIAIENARLFNQTKEALERQTATADILKVISGSPDDVQPVFDAVARSSMRLLGALSASVSIRAGDTLQLGAFTSTSKAGDQAVKALFPLSLTDNRDTILAQSVLKAAPAQVGDAQGSRRRPRLREVARRRGFQSIIAVPMLSKGRAIGTVSVTRREAGGFNEHEVELLTTFADQAVIAIENVRLFNETKESLEQQTATAEILKVISNSPTDVQPVLDAVAERAVKLCEPAEGGVFLLEGDGLRFAAGFETTQSFAPNELMPFTAESVTGRSILEGRTIHVADLAAASSDDLPVGRAYQARFGHRTILSAPLVRQGKAIGAVVLWRYEVQAFSEQQIALVQTFADQAAIAIENVRLFNETKEALERQTATAEILRVISSSPTDVQPVFDMISKLARKLCAADMSAVARFDGEKLQLVALEGVAEDGVEFIRRAFPMYPGEETVIARAFDKCDVEHVADVMDSPSYARKSAARGSGYRGGLGVPMIREGNVIGVIFVTRVVPGYFADSQVALLKTFADQAVIAIENVRLFNETKEALERQTASAEILRVIASSPSQVEPVFEAIVTSAMRLFNAKSAVLLQRGESHFSVGAYAGPDVADLPEQVRQAPLDPDKNFPSRAILRGEVVHISDWSGDGIPEHEKIVAKAFGIRSGLQVPLLRKGTGIGALAITRETTGHYGEKEIALLRSFADQAVIAIENVRLFNETQEALERQTATGEILKSISDSPTDVQPVFDTIVKNAVELSDALFSAVYRYDGELLHLVAHHNYTPEVIELLNRVYPMRADRRQAVGRAILDRHLVHIQDALTDADYQHDIAHTGGWRSMIAVPMFREATPVGVIWVARAQTGPFSDHQIELLETFADQAVIAIENVRLFNETKEALERQTATAEILRVISSSPTNVQPVFEAIVASAVRLCDAVQSAAITREDGMLHLVAHKNWTGEGRTLAESLFPMPADRDHLTAIAVRENRVIHSVNLQHDPEAPASSRELAIAQGYDALLIVPMLREGRSRGAIVVARKGPFTDHQIALLQTFADQAVIAIDNVRLFNETKEGLERQTATAEILSVIASSPSDVQPVFDAIARSARQLIDGRSAVVVRRVAEELQLEAVTATTEAADDALRKAFPTPLTGQAALGKAILSGQPAVSVDVEVDPAFSDAYRETMRARGTRSFLAVPMLREGKAIGGIAVTRGFTGPFSDHQIKLLQTFADQAVIAIENVRLFNETKEALEQQRASGEVLSVISNSIEDAQPVFEKIVESCERLFGGSKVGLNLVGADGLVHAGAYGKFPGVDKLRSEGFPHPANEESATGAAILARDVIHYPDVLGDPNVPFYARRGAEAVGFRSFIMAPLLSEGRGLGAIFVGRETVGSFSEKEITLLKAFANQAVIAIQNARLFNETKEALERQKATAEVLGSISSSMTDTQPVFESIVRSLRRLLGARSSVLQILRPDGMVDMPAVDGETRALQARFPRPLDDSTIGGRAMLTKQTIRLTPVLGNPETPPATLQFAKDFGFNSVIFTPMMFEGTVIGAISVAHADAKAFDERQVSLIKTFADQAVIAIENVRLFKELKERTEALTKSVGQLTALGEVSQALSSTLDVEQVLRTIASRAVQLSGLDGAAIYEYDEDRKVFTLRGGENIMPELVELYRSEPIRFGEGAVGRAAELRAPVQIADIEQGYQSRARDVLQRAGARALLAVPLLREGHILGAIAVIRNRPGDFAPEVTDLLQTFATQSAIAIQNARLFREIEEKGRQLEEASQHKSHFLASMSHELRTPLNAILGFNEMILGEVYGEVPADMKEPLEDIQTSGKHLLRLINNVLDLAKIEAGRMELALADYSVQDMVESVRATLRPLAEAKGLEFLVSVPNDVPLAHGDSGRLTQCLMNLAGNSLKFTKEGNVSISVEPNGETLAFRVTDTGIGIPPEKIDTLFTEFKQTDATIASEYGGTGLGLSISKKFIEMHGGRIWVESELGKGSSFIFEIPLRAEAGDAT